MGTANYNDRKSVNSWLPLDQAEWERYNDYRGVQSTFGGEEYVHYFEHSDGFTGQYLCWKISNYIF